MQQTPQDQLSQQVPSSQQQQEPQQLPHLSQQLPQELLLSQLAHQQSQQVVPVLQHHQHILQHPQVLPQIHQRQQHHLPPPPRRIHQMEEQTSATTTSSSKQSTKAAKPRKKKTSKSKKRSSAAITTTEEPFEETFTEDLLGIIGGSSLFFSSYFSNLEKKIIKTEYGDVILHFGKGFVFCQRHEADPNKEYTPPHLINKKAIITAMVKCNAKLVIAFGSVGSLSKDIPVGTVLVPDDFFNLWDSISFFEDKRGHIVPTLQSELRTEVVDLLQREIFSSNQPNTLMISGTYVQTTGPRFETVAEIKFLANCAHVVGMTAAHEAILCAEVKLPYALITMVDNMGHGLLSEEERLSMKQFHDGIKNNSQLTERILGAVIHNFSTPEFHEKERIKRQKKAEETTVTA